MKVQNLRFCGTPLYRYIEFAGIHTDPSFASEGTASPKLAVRSDDRTSQTCGLSGCRSCSPHSLLRRNGLISSEVVFIDGTKIEANANKYTFVWKKAVSKNQTRMLSKVAELIEVCEEVYGIRVAYNDRISLGTIKQLVLQLEKLCRKERVIFVSGTGKRKTPLQRYVEQAREYLQRMEDYVYKLDVCGDRNSYSKTDHDATFMRMKEDAMLHAPLDTHFCYHFFKSVLLKLRWLSIDCSVIIRSAKTIAHQIPPKSYAAVSNLASEAVIRM